MAIASCTRLDRWTARYAKAKTKTFDNAMHGIVAKNCHSSLIIIHLRNLRSIWKCYGLTMGSKKAKKKLAVEYLHHNRQKYNRLHGLGRIGFRLGRTGFWGVFIIPFYSIQIFSLFSSLDIERQ